MRLPLLEKARRRVREDTGGGTRRVPKLRNVEERVASGTEMVKLPKFESVVLESVTTPPDHSEGPERESWVLEQANVPSST